MRNKAHYEFTSNAGSMGADGEKPKDLVEAFLEAVAWMEPDEPLHITVTLTEDEST